MKEINFEIINFLFLNCDKVNNEMPNYGGAKLIIHAKILFKKILNCNNKRV